MRLTWLKLAGFVVFGCFLARGVSANDEKAKGDKKAAVSEEKKEAAGQKKEAPAEKKEGAEAPKGEISEAIVFDKAKLGKVTFNHKVHSEIAGGCVACHGGKEPLFKQERSKDVLKMKEMYEGKSCGACHDGKKPNKAGKPIFAARGACMKCHKK